MHVLNCQVAVGGDVLAKMPIRRATVPEIMVLQRIHGEHAVTAIEVLENPHISQLDERDRLLSKYPKHKELVIGLWRDHGGAFPSDIRELKLAPAFFAQGREAPFQAADELEEEELKAKPKRRGRPKKAVAAPPPEPEPEPETDIEGWAEDPQHSEEYAEAGEQSVL